MATLEMTLTFTTMECSECHMTFAAPKWFVVEKRRNHKTFYCPQGHQQYFPGLSDLEKVRAELEQAQRTAIRERNWRASAERNAAAARRSTAAVKGHLTRMRNKVANGVCPVPGCRRHFDNVQDHLRSKHEGWLAEHDVLISS